MRMHEGDVMLPEWLWPLLKEVIGLVESIHILLARGELK